MLATMSLPRTGGSVGATERLAARDCRSLCRQRRGVVRFAIYGALATVIAVVYFPAADPAAALSAAFAAYGTALLVRPIGAFVFGGDWASARASHGPDLGDFADGRRDLGGRLPAGLCRHRPACPARPPPPSCAAGPGRRGRARGGRRLPFGARTRLGNAAGPERGIRRPWGWNRVSGWLWWPCLTTCLQGREPRLGPVADRLLDRGSPRRDGTAAAAPYRRHRAIVALRAGSRFSIVPIGSSGTRRRIALLRGFCLLAAGR